MLGRGALETDGHTVAVLGCGIDRDYPAAHATLAQSIAERSLIVSEYEPGVEPAPWRFPARNRIIAGLCAATVVVEARERSGALITADFALEQGREVFAVPGSIFSPMSIGPHELLKQGATPATSSADILPLFETRGEAGDALGMARDVPELDPQEMSVWQALGGEPRHVDELARSLSAGSGEVSAALTMLELRGLARQVGSMLYTRT
jgi:DNA processing protein